jgi:hypothetical protein
MPHTAAPAGVWAQRGGNEEAAGYQRGKAVSARERENIILAFGALLGGQPVPHNRRHYAACGNIPAINRDWRTVRSVLEAASGPAPTLLPLPTGGAANRKPLLSIQLLLYVRARRPPARPPGGPAPARLRGSAGPRPSRAPAPPQALVRLRPSAPTAWYCDTVEDDLNLRVSEATMTRGLDLLGETRKKLTLLARPISAARSRRPPGARPSAARAAPELTLAPPLGAERQQADRPEFAAPAAVHHLDAARGQAQHRVVRRGAHERV